MKKIVFGIQGGVGSFNHEALDVFTKEKKISNYETKFLYTSEAVLNSLTNKKIDMGIFAIYNLAGGIVEESLEAMAKYVFKIEDKFFIPIRHFLMKRKDADFENIEKIMAHPQVLKQCRLSLALKYKGFDLESGKGDLIDTARLAKELYLGNTFKNIAVLGSKQLATLYDLEIIDSDLQDSRDNQTTFLVVKGV